VNRTYPIQERWPEAKLPFVLNAHPHYDLVNFMLGECELRLGQSEDAIPLFRKVI
jgi:hypothetical protein